MRDIRSGRSQDSSNTVPPRSVGNFGGIGAMSARPFCYHPEAATLAYQKRRQRCVRPHILCTNIELRHTVHFLLGYLYWSPAQISSRLKKEGTFQISAATIYRALENGQLRPSLRYFLRHKYKTFGKRRRSGETALKSGSKTALLKRICVPKWDILKAIPSLGMGIDPAL